MNYKSFNHLSEDIKSNLNRIHNGGYDLVVGVPRSGMIPAYMIGLYLNIHVTDFDSYIKNSPVKKGITRKAKNSLVYAQDAQRVLVVDDSIMSGESLYKTLKRLPENLKEKVTTLVVYSDRNKRDDIDLFFEVVPIPRVFEWNIFHRDLLARACVDIDGVLCVDPSDYENDDGERYAEFLLNAKPHIIPTYKIHSLVTSRLEKYRLQTEAWLNKNGIEYDHLIMLDLPNKEARQIQGAHATHKANYFKKMTDLEIFIESDLNQAMSIAKASGKPVYCVDKNKMFTPGAVSIVKNNVGGIPKKLLLKLLGYFPYKYRVKIISFIKKVK